MIPCRYIVLLASLFAVLNVSAVETPLSAGDSYRGQLGNGLATGDSLTPAKMATKGSFRVIGGGDYHSLAVNYAGHLYGWGDGSQFALGDAVQPHNTPAFLFGDGLVDGSTVTAVDGGYYFSIALTSKGTVGVWGFDDESQLGDGGGDSKQTPYVLPLAKPAIAIAAGEAHALAVDSDGVVFAWGRNTSGQIGTGTKDPVLRPVAVAGLAPAKAVGAGTDCSVALLVDGTVATWGDNSFRQLGDGTTVAHLTPAPVPGLSGVKAIATGAYGTVALKDDGSVWGFGNLFSSAAAPIPGLYDIVAIAAGLGDFFFLRGDGTVLAMGENQSGLLGVGDKVRRSAPVVVPGLPAITAIGASGRTATFAPSNIAEITGQSVDQITATSAVLHVTLADPTRTQIVEFKVDGVSVGMAFTLGRLEPSVEVELTANNLAPHATHSFVGVAKNGAGLVTDHSAAVTFKTLNRPPVMIPATYVLGADGTVTFSGSQVASDPDGDVLTIAPPSSDYGTFKHGGTPSRPLPYWIFTPNDTIPPSFGPRTVRMHVTDGFGGVSDEVEMQVIDTTPPTISVDASSLGTFKAGDPVPDLQAVAKIRDNGPGLIVSQDPAPGTAFPFGPLRVLVKVADAGGNLASATVTLLALPEEPTVLEAISTAPGGPGFDYRHVGLPALGPKGYAVFWATGNYGGARHQSIAMKTVLDQGVPLSTSVSSYERTVSLGTPAISATGKVAYTARLAKPNGTPGELALFATMGPAQGSYFPSQIVVTTGDALPAPGSGKITRIEQFVVADDTVLMLLRVQGPGRTESQVLARHTFTRGFEVMARTGTPMLLGGTNRVVKAIRGFEPISGSTGHGRVFNGGGAAVVRLEFQPRGEAIATIFPGSPIITEVVTGQLIDGATEKGAPVTGTLFDLQTASHAFAPAADRPTLAFQGSLSLTSGGIDTAIFVQDPGNGGAPSSIARVGQGAPGLSPLTFRSLSDPVLAIQPNAVPQVAFTARLGGSSVSAKNDAALFAGNAIAGGPKLVARIGDEAPGAEGARFAKFVSFTLPGWDGAGPLFTAQLAGGDTKPGNLGLWSTDAAGVPRLVLRTGDQVYVAGQPRTVRNLIVLTDVPGSSAQQRATNLLHEVAMKVVFTDFTEAVVTVVVP